MRKRSCYRAKITIILPPDAKGGSVWKWPEILVLAENHAEAVGVAEALAPQLCEKHKGSLGAIEISVAGTPVYEVGSEPSFVGGGA